jgi:Zn-dependent protease with chaperone function
MSLLTQSALLRALGWSLFNSLWQMSLLWAVYHFFLLIVNRLPARSRHGLALLLLTVGTGWSALTFFQAYSFPETVPQGSQWLSTLLPAAAIGGVLSRIGHWLVSVALPWGSSLYLIILSGLLMRYFRHYFQSRAITRTGLSKITSEFSVFTATTARQMGIRATVGVYLSSLVDVPVTLGFLKPVILLPVAMLTHLQTAQVEAILVHELAHIQRKDYLLNLMVTAIELLFFFNPFTRMLVGSLKKEREHCCDDQVLEFHYDPHAYVSALLSLARKNGREGLALAAIGGGSSYCFKGPGQSSGKRNNMTGPVRAPCSFSSCSC